jgi:predicted O-linked N-acetylglucosamine transferase (SPINDLY family)
VARYLLPLLEAHDREAFEVSIYSTTLRESSITGRIRAAADGWRPMGDATDQQLAERIRADGIDILVDCSLHMTDNRMLAFARKPAPVQFTHIGYPSTTGSPAIDWRFSDPLLDPENAALGGPEKIWRLPMSWWLFQPYDDAVPVSGRPVVRNGFVTFGSLNNPSKSSPEAIRQWAAVLRAVPNSRLVLLAQRSSSGGSGLETFVAEEIVKLGVEPGRIELVPLTPRPGYLAYYGKIDVVIDPYPYTGHSTSIDAMWMGVPVISRTGGLPTSRAGASLAWAMGLEGWVGGNLDKVVAIAARVAADAPGLVKLSGELRERVRASSLMDARRYTRAVEEGYRAAWREWCERA